MLGLGLGAVPVGPLGDGRQVRVGTLGDDPRMMAAPGAVSYQIQKETLLMVRSLSGYSILRYFEIEMSSREVESRS